MKKIYLVLMGVAALSFATLSCSKEAVDPSRQEQNQKEETVKEEPAKEDPSGDTPVPEGMIRLTFGVSQEGDASANEGDDTKTTWDGTTHGWSVGDKIRIIVGEGDVEGTDYVDADVDVVDEKLPRLFPRPIIIMPYILPPQRIPLRKTRGKLAFPSDEIKVAPLKMQILWRPRPARLLRRSISRI